MMGENSNERKSKILSLSLPPAVVLLLVVDVVDVDPVSRGGTLCKSSAEVYQHQRHPRRVHAASSFYFCVSRFRGLFLEMTHFAFSRRWKTPPRNDDDVVVDAAAGLPSFYFILVSRPTLLSRLSDVFHCRPLFRLLLLTFLCPNVVTT